MSSGGRSLGAQDRYIVKFKDAQLGMAALKAAGADVLFELSQSNAAAAKIPAAALAGLQRNPHVAYVEPDAERHLLSQTAPYGIAQVQADLVPFVDPTTGVPLPANRKVCIIDTGYDLGHPDLPTNVTAAWHPCDPTAPKCRVTTGNPLTDMDGHGTHVAGTIAALNNDIGVLGVLPEGNVNLHIIKIFGDDGLWVTRASNLVRALEQCREAGANVVSMSLGGGSPTTTERDAFASALAAGVLPIAAAGNDGTTAYSYPASYPSVVSVAAIDEGKAVASFSQQNDQVELAAPGVNVLSTIPRGHGLAVELTVGGAPYAALGMDGSPLGSASGAVVDCGIGDAVCANATGKVCLIARGTIAFSDKVLSCQNGGGVAAVIYNNIDGPLSGTLGGVATTIPSMGISLADGLYIQANRLGQLASASITLSGWDYALYNGTSMATPHVSAVAALVWSHFPSCAAAAIRGALTASAEDLGTAGRDTAFGYGLVQSKAAVDYLTANGCAPPPPACTKTETTETSCADGKDNDCDGAIDAADSDCQSTAPVCKVGGVKCKLATECCSLSCVKVKPTDRFGTCAALP